MKGQTAQHLQDMDDGATIVCALPPYENWTVTYDPRTPKDRAPWRVANTRYSGSDVKAVKPDNCPTCDGDPSPEDAERCQTCNGQGLVFTDWASLPKALKLGKDQSAVLDCLSRYGSWYEVPNEGVPWAYGTPSRTRLIMDSLVRRGLVRKTWKAGREYPVYTLA